VLIHRPVTFKHEFKMSIQLMWFRIGTNEKLGERSNQLTGSIIDGFLD
jgi:hypothetical protein